MAALSSPYLLTRDQSRHFRRGDGPETGRTRSYFAGIGTSTWFVADMNRTAFIGRFGCQSVFTSIGLGVALELAGLVATTSIS